MSMTLIDESGPIRCTIFQEGVDKYNEMLVDGKVLFFSKGQIKNANKKFSSVNCEYEISMDGESEIWQVHSNDQSESLLPEKAFNFIPIESLRVKPKGSTMDVIGILASVGQPQAITTKAGNSITKRSVAIADQTALVEVALWDAAAENWEHPVGMVIGFKAARIAEFNGDISLSLNMGSAVETDLSSAKPEGLLSWYRESGEKVNVPKISKGGNGPSSKAAVLHRNTLEEIQRLGLGKGEKADYITVRATITHIKQENMFYDACPTCHRKVISQNLNSGPYRCERCDQTHEVADARFLLSLMISDGTSQMWVTGFDDVAKKVLGVSAEEFRKQSMEDAQYATSLRQRCMYAQFLAKLRVKEEQSGESGEDRLRLMLVDQVRWIGIPHGSPDAPVSTFTTESGIMMKEIDAHFT
ncbi:replication factor A 51kDa subunit [Perkinsela sp. CCAP 1560/4]|nr:replication factor A 51kDa subunit [Perkinsela sp. CCAP 1560/4]|eukprot:KNH05000.1 replication factor A 51kDa subunit [Perkinsela sp. CCAP 1560/4]